MKKEDIVNALLRQTYKDSTYEKRILFNEYLNNKKWAKPLYIVLNKLPVKLKLVIAFFYALFWTKKNPEVYSLKKIGFYFAENEKRALENYDKNIYLVKPHLFTLSNCIKIDLLRDIIFGGGGISNRFVMDEKPLYIQMRLFQLIFFFYLYKDLNTADNEIYVSSDSHPFASALIELLKHTGQLNFIAHSPYISNVSYIYVNKCVLFGEESYFNFLDCKSKISEVIYYENFQKELQFREENEYILINLPKVYSEKVLFELVNYLMEEFEFKKIILRLHPHSLRKYRERIRGIEISQNNSIFDDIERSFLSISGHSNTLIESILKGCYGFYLKDLDFFEDRPSLNFIKRSEVPMLTMNELKRKNRYDLQSYLEENTKADFVKKYFKT